jgi:hypothetical protein
MQIILTQNEIEDAIRDTVLRQMAIKDDQSIAVVFEDDADGNLIASIDIKKAAPVVEAEVEPKPRARKEAPIAAAVQPEEAKSPVPPQFGREPVKAEAKDLPWKEEEPGKEVAQAPAVGPLTPKIFPNVSTSAPARPEALAQGAKSLFANLTKSVHEASQV